MQVTFLEPYSYVLVGREKVAVNVIVSKLFD